MPTYEYVCEPSKHRFEVRQGINDSPLETCPQCGGPLRRVIHPVGIVFKGSGFYATDSRKSATSDQASSKPAGDSSTESTSSTPKDVTPAKSDSKATAKPAGTSDSSSS